MAGWFGRGGKGGSGNPLDADAVSDRASFLRFLTALRADLTANPDSWENATLPDYLEAMEGWTGAWDFERSPNPWRHAAMLLAAAKVYE